MDNNIEKKRNQSDDKLGGDLYRRDVELSKRKGAAPDRAGKLALEAWSHRNFGNIEKALLVPVYPD